MKLISGALQYKDRIAITSNGQSYSYGQLREDSGELAARLLDGAKDLSEKRIAFMVQPGYDYVRVQWAIWQAGGVAVPLCLTYPLPSLAYVLEDTGAQTVVVVKQYVDLLQEYAMEKGLQFLVLEELDLPKVAAMPMITPDRRAMILYTSGTTNLPKGVVSTHANLEAQISMLVEAWRWSPDDGILCILPLHHVHGIVNVIGCALWSGARVVFQPRFDPPAVFRSFLEDGLTLFMAVPTIYYKLIAHFDGLTPGEQRVLGQTMRSFRLMVSGSAALPVSVMERWQVISGHTLLERYGMTEMGMAISNPYEGERRPGHIGQALPGVSVRLVDEDHRVVPLGESGEIQVKGANVFHEYWQKPQATKDTFTTDGWFKTGDIAVLDDGYYRILGRSSVDIIKSGGYKISALEIEEVLRTHPDIKDCAVVGIPDDEWGELVVAALVSGRDEPWDSNQLDAWIRERMPAYRVPRKYLVVGDLPRNAMGKVTKKEVKKLFE